MHFMKTAFKLLLAASATYWQHSYGEAVLGLLRQKHAQAGVGVDEDRRSVHHPGWASTFFLIFCPGLLP